MKTLSIAEFKTNLSEITQRILNGEEFIVTHGRKKRKIFRVSPIIEARVKRRKLGTLKDKGVAIFSDDWETSETDLMDMDGDK